MKLSNLKSAILLKSFRVLILLLIDIVVLMMITY